MIDVRRMERTDLFQTDLRQVFDLIRFSGNRERLRDLIEQEPAYGRLEEDAFDFVSSYVGLRELSVCTTGNDRKATVIQYENRFSDV